MAAATMRVGLIGLGAIGSEVARQTRAGAVPDAEIVGALVRDPKRARPAECPKTVLTLEELLAERPDIVVEAGGHAALVAHGPAVLRSGRDLIIVSVGAFARPGVFDEIVAAARAGGAQARIVSGAIGGLDALAAAALAGLTRVTHTTRKPARTLLAGDEAASVVGSREVFRGTAREAALRFPESVNVAAAVSVAGIGLDRTEVRVVADPALTRNQHHVVAEGAFGAMRIEIDNVPSPSNPRTARLAALSVVQTLRKLRSPIVVG